MIFFHGATNNFCSVIQAPFAIRRFYESMNGFNKAQDDRKFSCGTFYLVFAATEFVPYAESDVGRRQDVPK